MVINAVLHLKQDQVSFREVTIHDLELDIQLRFQRNLISFISKLIGRLSFGVQLHILGVKYKDFCKEKLYISAENVNLNLQNPATSIAN